VLHLAAEEIDVAHEHELLAPTLLRSPALSLMHEAVRRGEVADDVARDRLDRVGRMKIDCSATRCCADVRGEIASRLGWESTSNAEYIALTQPQADAFVTLDPTLARSVDGVVEVASIDALR
jgi:hypothetical protein